MWALEEITGYREGSRFLIKNLITGGYLSDNAVNGGALHFMRQQHCELIVDALNASYTK